MNKKNDYHINTMSMLIVEAIKNIAYLINCDYDDIAFLDGNRPLNFEDLKRLEEYIYNRIVFDETLDKK